MRFESVTARAFGPLKNKTLKLAPAMNVLYGANEAAKSSGHAALYAGLCGRRRGRGRTEDDVQFEARHRPWDDAGEWAVGVIVKLEDGRRVELSHDLAGKFDSKATDAVLGRDYTSEIVNDGSPDGAVWLGLDRRSFVSTACMEQADLHAVMNDAKGLQGHLQRAADTLGTDSTAAVALEKIGHALRENVGQNAQQLCGTAL